MTETLEESRSVTVECVFAHPPEKVWRALTEGHLLEAWLMKNDFQPVVGHRFTFTADWGSVVGEVMTVEPYERLVYSWGAFGMGHVVTWTLTPTDAGTRVRVEQSGFRPDQTQAYMGAKYGWPRFLEALDRVLAG
jgi:uncharacterized protein YndB with AHSA1/START domain